MALQLRHIALQPQVTLCCRVHGRCLHDETESSIFFLDFRLFSIHAMTTFPTTIDIIALCLDLITIIFASVSY